MFCLALSNTSEKYRHDRHPITTKSIPFSHQYVMVMSVGSSTETILRAIAQQRVMRIVVKLLLLVADIVDSKM